MKNFAASNHNIPEVALKILGALNYFELNLLTTTAMSSQAVQRAKPSNLFSTYQCKDAMISIASSTKDKPVTVTIVKALDHGMTEDILFHFDPIKKILLTARQLDDGSVRDGI
jgi:hypothetical protein